MKEKIEHQFPYKHMQILIVRKIRRGEKPERVFRVGNVDYPTLLGAKAIIDTCPCNQ